MIKKGQSTLEFALVFIIVAALILGLLFLWEWSKNNIGSRQGAFERDRVKAGKRANPGKPPISFYAGPPGEPNYLSR